MLAGLYAKLITAAAIIALVLAGVFYVKRLQAKVEHLTAENTLLQQSVKEQNDAVDQLKKDADARVKAGEAAIAAAQEATKKAKGKATIIYKSKPSTPGNDCKSALDLINTTSTPVAPVRDVLKLLNGETK